METAGNDCSIRVYPLLDYFIVPLHSFVCMVACFFVPVWLWVKYLIQAVPFVQIPSGS